MPLPQLWTIFHKYSQSSCACCSLILNSVLIALIILHSPKKLGMYKYLMIYIAVFEQVYSLLDLLSEPQVHCYGSAFVVFRNMRNSIFARVEGFYFIVVYCGFFGFSLAIFGIHFIYRYGAVNNDKTDEYMRETILKMYDLQIEETSYICVFYYQLDQNMQKYPDWPTFLGISVCWCEIMTSMWAVFYFGIKCFTNIKNALHRTTNVSNKTKSLQQQLFQALVVQTAIPLILMYIPIAVLFIFPMINFDIGFTSSFVAITIAIYPAIDPLPNMFIIKNYRLAIFDFVRRFILSSTTTARQASCTNPQTINAVSRNLEM